ncbi:MAG: transcriptional regulator [Bacteroidales bacterium]|jgi:DNA-binding MarR family transcriptional regulator|nr:transcriptional regulator [Bacteroidales bacterium]
MKEILTPTVTEHLKLLDRAFENSTRLGIMSALMVADSVSYTELKNLLKVSDGNIAGHIKILEREEYISVIKQFIDRKPNTSYSVTEKGRTAFLRHLDALEAILKQR